MAKLLQLSVLSVPAAMPVMAARTPDPAKGLKKAVVRTLWFNLFYLFIIMFVHGPHSS